MFSNGYVGSAHDSQRIRRQEKEREDERKQLEDERAKVAESGRSAGLRQFAATQSEKYENAFKDETVGLVTREEFMAKRANIKERLEEEAAAAAQHAEQAALAEREKRKLLAGKSKPKLSFAMDDEEEEEGEDEPAAAAAGQNNGRVASGAGASTSKPAAVAGEPAAKKAKFGKLGKDPTVSTEFLPDKDREREEAALRQQLKREWAAEQERIKNAPLEVTYSYWDGAGHRRKITVRRGDTIGGFLKAVREQLAPSFRELRAVSSDNLLYIKEDLIMPQHYTFHELILNKARGKSGPLFDFGVTEDVRIMNDATVEKTDAHAGKVVERHWYERNKHIFPANRWEIYDPEKTYDTYTIFG